MREQKYRVAFGGNDGLRAYIPCGGNLAMTLKIALDLMEDYPNDVQIMVGYNGKWFVVANAVDGGIRSKTKRFDKLLQEMIDKRKPVGHWP